MHDPAETAEQTPMQMAFPYAASLRMTKQQYEYATIRGRLPASFTDWQCKLLADGVAESEFARYSRQERRQISTVLCRWHAMPAVQAQIEYERALSLETRLAEPLRAWQAKMAKLYAMAAGELPLTRTVTQIGEDGSRHLLVEEYLETSLTALAKAVEMEGRALAVFKDRQELSGPDGAAAAIEVRFVSPRAADDDNPGEG